MNVDSSLIKNQPATGNKKIQEELKELREAFVINFNEQMKLRLVKQPSFSRVPLIILVQEGMS